MRAAVLSEFRKIYTVRSSYFIVVIVLLLIALVGGQAMSNEVGAGDLASPSFLESRVIILMSVVALLSGIAGILQFSHEYRFNTIMYTLTNTRSRTNILLAKIVALSGYAAVFTALAGSFAFVALIFGLQLHDKSLVPQTVAWGELIWKSFFITWGYTMFGAVLVGLARNQVFAVATFLALPMIIEQLLSLALKDNAWYLPFMAMNAVTSNPPELSSGNAVLVVLGYIGGGWILSWILFLRRDAN